MAITRGGSSTQPRRSPRLQLTRQPRKLITETIDLVESTDTETIEEEQIVTEEEMSKASEHERHNPPRRNSDDEFLENVGRTFKEIKKRFKRKSHRPPLSPDKLDGNDR